jgi:type II secretory pathway predicted ATPase ExeA/septal ring-binding cell division protein DamX
VYEEYFGLNRQPFRITPDTSLFFDGGHRGDILGALVYAVHRGEGIIKVVGEVGSGKTMLCRMLQIELPDSVEIIYIANPSVSPEDILFVIADELKFDVKRDASKHELVSLLQNYLLKRHAENKQVVLFVEEAQGMPLETLEEIRLLSNLETDQHKLLQIILFGQPELDENLANNSIRQLRERITHDFNLSPLSSEEIHKYLNFRMREVGYTGPELISKKLAQEMAKHSAGLLRRINILADKMLLSAFADDTHTVTSRHLMNAVKDSGFSELHSKKSKTLSIMLISAIFLLLIFLAGYLFYKQGYRLAQRGAEPVRVSEAEKNHKAEIIQPTVVNGAVQKEENRTESTTGSPVYAQQLNQQVLATESFKEEVKVAEGIARDIEKNKAFTNKVAQNSVPTEAEVNPVTEMPASSKKNQQSVVKLDKVTENQPLEVLSSSRVPQNYDAWLQNKIQQSIKWLKEADAHGVSIQVMMRSKLAMKELAIYLQNDWPLELDKTYIYEVKLKDRSIYRVFYGEYATVSQGHERIKQLPESVRVNSPYLHSIYRMQEELL